MPSTYTTNLGIEKIATGEQSGTWGTTTNTNFDMFDQAINGLITVTASGTGSSGSPNTLPITDGAVSNGRNAFIEINDGGDLGGNVFYQLTPNNAEKILYIRNSLTTQDLILFQGTYNASNDIVVPNGKDMVVKFSGTGSGATVTDVFNDLRATKIDPATLSINGTAVSSTAAELNILDGSSAGTIVNSKAVVYGASGEVNATTLQIAGNSITSTAAELNIVDGNTAATSTTLVDADRVVVNDNGTMVQVAMTDVQTYVNANLDADVVKKDENNTFTAAQRGSTDTDTTNTGSVTLNFDTNQNFVLTLTGNVTLANPTTESVGQSGFIVFIQDGTGGRTVSLGTDYETAGGAGLTLSSAASATDVVPYIVAASGRILLGTPQLAFS